MFAVATANFLFPAKDAGKLGRTVMIYRNNNDEFNRIYKFMQEKKNLAISI
jgi:hypothetical protein